MKAKMFAALLSVVAITISIAAAVSKEVSSGAKKELSSKATSTSKAPVAVAQRPAGLPVMIDGSMNPEMIPDEVAYSILFRFLSNRQTEDEKNSVRAYLKQRLCGSCNENKDLEASTDNIIDAVLAAAEQFNQRIAPLDSNARSIKDQHWPNPSRKVMAQLTRLQDQKEALVLETVTSLQTRLDAESLTRVQRLIHDNFKRKIKISPGPQSPPGGPEWRSMPSMPRHH